jgi:hypothetical protein
MMAGQVTVEQANGNPVTVDPGASAAGGDGTQTAAQQADQKTRLQVFANVFKSYMGVMPLVTAALAPLLTAMNVLPMYGPQRKALATIAGMLGFLLLAWLFYVRRTIALGSITHGYRTLFNFLPLVLILGSIAGYVAYASKLDASVAAIQQGLVQQKEPAQTRSQILASWTNDHAAPQMLELELLYLGMFLSAEAAFVMMAMREYAIDVLGMTEQEWMYGAQDGSAPKLKEAKTNGVKIAAAKSLR